MPVRSDTRAAVARSAILEKKRYAQIESHSPAMKKATLETPSIQSLDRGLSILEAVAKSADPVPLGHLTDLLGIDRSSVFRLANTLRRRGFLANPTGGRDYILGPSILRLSRKFGGSNMLIGFCREPLKALAIKTGETAHLAVRHGSQALFLDHHSSSNQIIVVSGQTGETVPLYCTAHGKALLAGMNESQLREIFGSGGFERHTPQTITTIEDLARSCAEIDALGYALDDGEFIPEVRCVAAPISDKDGTVVASIGISAPVVRFPAEQDAFFSRQVKDIAAEITNILSAEVDQTADALTFRQAP
jgi:IclR family transcriptional regulator, acetate operon repressor